MIVKWKCHWYYNNQKCYADVALKHPYCLSAIEQHCKQIAEII